MYCGVVISSRSRRHVPISLAPTYSRLLDSEDRVLAGCWLSENAGGVVVDSCLKMRVSVVYLRVLPPLPPAESLRTRVALVMLMPFSGFTCARPKENRVTRGGRSLPKRQMS